MVEVGFIGRSNVGKSSLINMLAGQRGLAKVSGTPGKTRLLNHFVVDDSWFLVDLPGYGYAKTSKSRRAEFGRLIQNYVTQRAELYCLFVLVDIRHSPQAIDVDFMAMLGAEGVPFAIVFTKGDKLSKTQRERHIAAYNEVLSQWWEELPQHFVTSSESGLGRDELVGYIESLVADFEPVAVAAEKGDEEQ